MVIEEVDIQIYPIDTAPHLLQQSLRSGSESFSREDKFYLLFVFILGSYGGCDYYHETRAPRSSDGIVLWRNGDTIIIDVMAVHVEGNTNCPDAIFNHRETVFAGFCSSGQYTLNVNHIQKQFTVGTL